MKMNGVGDGNASAGVELFQRVNNPVQAPKEAAEAAASGPSVIVDISARNGNSMMADLFVHDESTPSRYVQANMDRMRDLGAMRQRQNSIVQQGMASVAALGDTNGRYDQIILEGRKAAEKIEDEKGTAVTEATETLLEQNREEMEERAEKAVNPVDENGNPVQDTEAKEAAAMSAKKAETPASSLSAAPGETPPNGTLTSDTATNAVPQSGTSASASAAASATASATASALATGEANSTPSNTAATQKRVDLTV